MRTDKVDFTGVQSTMLVTLYLRALDSADPEPILGDRFAAEAVRRIDYDWAKLDKPHIRRSRTAGSLRPKLFDDWTADFLRHNPEATVLQLACGLDTRAFRLTLPTGVHWFDVDLPDVIELRRMLYSENENYHMIAASVTEQAWLDGIPAGKPVLIIAEGLLMYLPEHEVRQLLHRLTEHFPRGELIFDGFLPWVPKLTQLTKKVLGRRYAYPPYLTGIRDGSDIERWNPRLRCRERIAILDRIGETKLGRNPVLRMARRFDRFRNTLCLFRADYEPRSSSS
ncbi:class I SAM-dependent methyltransferase [Sciscionella sediminilitoris]|uniref:class I SAM-dependent methyltransferase n=1 Tax=Sciscionella sediminilitoris TaxID=1445613 RepID=UPI0004DFACA5|nr:class I SAM-dependent methyltransferase [Sciscionella sp. SE31]